MAAMVRVARRRRSRPRARMAATSRRSSSAVMVSGARAETMARLPRAEAYVSALWLPMPFVAAVPGGLLWYATFYEPMQVAWRPQRLACCAVLDDFIAVASHDCSDGMPAQRLQVVGQSQSCRLGKLTCTTSAFSRSEFQVEPWIHIATHNQQFTTFAEHTADFGQKHFRSSIVTKTVSTRADADNDMDRIIVDRQCKSIHTCIVGRILFHVAREEPNDAESWAMPAHRTSICILKKDSPVVRICAQAFYKGTGVWSDQCTSSTNLKDNQRPQVVLCHTRHLNPADRLAVCTESSCRVLVSMASHTIQKHTLCSARMAQTKPL